MTAALAAAAASAAVLVSRPNSRRRLAGPPRRVSVSRRRVLVALVVPAVAAIAMVGVAAVVAAASVAAAGVVRHRLRTTTPGAGADLALALDVLAGCLSSGASMPAALCAARIAAPARVDTAFATTASALQRGDDPATRWAQLGAEVPELAAVARLCARSATTGAAVADELHRFAAAHRTALDTSRRRRLQRASVWMVLPLGLCFLPAFVLVGVVPMVLSAVSGLSQGR